jgi:hypothetical protein
MCYSLIVGYPLIPNLVPKEGSAVQSILATFASPFNLVATSSYVGANFLQYPHQGACNVSLGSFEF